MPTTTTKYIWDEDNYLAESDATNTINVVYTNEPQQYGNLVSTRIPGTSSYHHYDAIGSTRQLTNTAGHITNVLIYDAWGNINNRTGSTRNCLLWIGQVGYYYDRETGLIAIRGRSLHPATARWTSVDALLALNLYIYALNSPLRKIDPSGLIEWDVDSKECTVTMEFYFQLRFVPAAANDPDPRHTWTPERIQKFARLFSGVVEGCWSNPPFRIQPYCCNCPFGWTPLLKIFLDALPPDNVASVSANAPVDPTTGEPHVQSSSNDEGTSTLDEQDIYLWPTDPGLSQITACHEFGHMIGLTHPVNPNNPQQTGYEFDLPSLMGSGMELRMSYYELWSAAATPYCHGFL